MKGYGLPRVLDIEFPDVYDIRYYALKSSTGKLAGDQHGYVRSSKVKKKIRRIYKRKARNIAKRKIYMKIILDL